MARAIVGMSLIVLFSMTWFALIANALEKTGKDYVTIGTIRNQGVYKISIYGKFFVDCAGKEDIKTIMISKKKIYLYCK